MVCLLFVVCCVVCLLFVVFCSGSLFMQKPGVDAILKSYHCFPLRLIATLTLIKMAFSYNCHHTSVLPHTEGFRPNGKNQKGRKRNERNNKGKGGRGSNTNRGKGKGPKRRQEL